MTEYEQKVTRTLYWLTAASHSDALLSSSRGGTRIDWWPEYTLKPEAYVQTERLRGLNTENNTMSVPATNADSLTLMILFLVLLPVICSKPLVYLQRHQRANPRPQ